MVLWKNREVNWERIKKRENRNLKGGARGKKEKRKGGTTDGKGSRIFFFLLVFSDVVNCVGYGNKEDSECFSVLLSSVRVVGVSSHGSNFLWESIWITIYSYSG